MLDSQLDIAFNLIKQPHNKKIRKLKKHFISLR